MRLRAVLFLLPVFVFCVFSSKNYQLTSLSDPQPRDERAVFALVTLRSDSGNTLAIFNWGKYKAFNIYRAESPQDAFQLLGMLNAGPEGSSLSLLPFFLDKNSSPDNRYRVYPVAGEDELMRLPMVYETPDKTYFRKIEKPPKKK